AASSCTLVSFSGSYACLGSGWSSSVPACGVGGSYKSCSARHNVFTGSWSCVSSTSTLTQECR
ncbi:MAG: hypothetical protein ACK4N5_08335, partial [Myxococcales bacterium]